MEPDEKGIKAGMQPFEGPMKYANMASWLDMIVGTISRGDPGKAWSRIHDFTVVMNETRQGPSALCLHTICLHLASADVPCN
jgi:hypothetical protein